MNNDKKEFGIGRVPADVDQTSEAVAEIESTEIMQRHSPAPQFRGKCARCGTPLTRVSAMSSSRGVVCPDCYDTYSD